MASAQWGRRPGLCGLSGGGGAVLLADPARRAHQLRRLPLPVLLLLRGQPLFIDLDDLAGRGLLEREGVRGLDWGDDPSRVDYGKLYENRYPVLRLACGRLEAREGAALDRFCREAADWLEDYALFMALKGKFGGASWQDWPRSCACAGPDALEAARRELGRGGALLAGGVQYLFFTQWRALKERANRRGISIIGDLPIYAAGDSADVWASPEQFQLDEEGRPTQVAGCPPRRLHRRRAAVGQPNTRSSVMKQEGYAWWLRRLAFQFRIYDILRLDHFRGFEAYYAIPAGEATARNGHWEPGPGMDFFRAAKERLGRREIIAEDLGFLTPAVRAMLRQSGFPGMKVLQFAFDSRDKGSDYLPHCYPRRCVVYTGTHDNDTILGWMKSAPGRTCPLPKSTCG